MKIMLLEDVQGQGRKGDIIDVAPGYANNFLIRKGFAVVADSQALSEYKNQEESRIRRDAEDLAAAEKIAEVLNEKTLKITAKAGEGKLFGAVTTSQVAEEIKKEFDVDVDRRKIDLEDIKAFGTYTANIKLGSGVTTSLFVTVTEE